MNPVRKVRLGGRREMRLRDRSGPNGFWRFTRHRVRTLVDYEAIAEHPRAPAWAREHAQRWIDAALAEARGFASRQEGSTPADGALGRRDRSVHAEPPNSYPTGRDQ